MTLILGFLTPIYALLQGPWDQGLLPGVFPDYNQNFTAAHQMIQDIHSKMNKVSWWLIGFLILVACVVYVSGAMATLKVNPEELILKGILVTALLAGYNTIFGTVMATGNYIGEQIASREDILRASAIIEAQQAGAQASQAAADSGAGMIVALGKILFAADATGLLTMAIIALCIILMFIGSFFVNTVWLIFVVALYIFGPISIALVLIPGVGSRLTSTWFGAIVQLSAWQIWMAICWRLIEIAGLLHPWNKASGATPTISSLTDTSVSFEAAAFALVFALLYLATPFIVQGLLPLSSFSAMAGTMGLFLEAKAVSMVSGGGGSGSSSASSASPTSGGSTSKAPSTPSGGKAGSSSTTAASSGGGGGSAAGASAGGGGAAAGAGPAGGAVAGAAVALEAGSTAAGAVKSGVESQAQSGSNNGGG